VAGTDDENFTYPHGSFNTFSESLMQ
jgi:hypothetical protein